MVLKEGGEAFLVIVPLDLTNAKRRAEQGSARPSAFRLLSISGRLNVTILA